MDAYLACFVDSLRAFLAKLAVWQFAELVAARNPGRSKVDWWTAPELNVKLAAGDAAKARDAIRPCSLSLDDASLLGIANELFERVLDRSGITILRDPPDLDRGPGLHKVFNGEWWGPVTSEGVPRSVPIPDDDVDLATLQKLLSTPPAVPDPHAPASAPAEAPVEREETAGTPAPPPPPPDLTTDESALVTALRKSKKPKQARLVEFMIGKEEAEVQTIAEKVHGHTRTTEDAVEKNARATSDSAASLGYRLKYFFRSGRVFKETAAE
jgi:hypothetical protein